MISLWTRPPTPIKAAIQELKKTSILDIGPGDSEMGSELILNGFDIVEFVLNMTPDSKSALAPHSYLPTVVPCLWSRADSDGLRSRMPTEEPDNWDLLEWFTAP